MSRIDEAWKRASGLAATAQPPQIPMTVPDAGPVGAAPLDRYPIEQAPAAIASNRAGAAVPPAPREVAPIRIPASLRGRLVVGPEVEPLSVEQYRRMAATLEEQQAQRSLRSITVSSALPRDGKTLTATNIALTLSENYRRRVLLIDADFHRPSVHTMFGMSNEAGLADALRAQDAALPLVRVSPTLSVLPTGQVKGSPLAALSAEHLRTLIAQAAARFDWVFIDTPPLGLVTDAQLVSRVTDGVVFVIGAGATPYTLVQQMLADIGIERIVGTVLNRVEEHTIPVRDYYRRHYGTGV